MKIVFLPLTLGLAFSPAFAQAPVQIVNPCLQQACFFATQSATVTMGSSTTLTVQQPAAGIRQVSFLAAIVQCPGQAFTVSQAQNGTAATATAGTAVALVPIQVTGGGTAVSAAAKVFTASNVGGGTATAPVLSYSSGQPPVVVDLLQRTMGVTSPVSNYSVTLTNGGSGSCTGTVSIYWGEKI